LIVFQDRVEAFFAPYLGQDLACHLEAHHPDSRLVWAGVSRLARDCRLEADPSPRERTSGYRPVPITGLEVLEIHPHPAGPLARVEVVLADAPPRSVAVLGTRDGLLLGAAWDPSGDALREVLEARIAAEWAQAPADLEGMWTVLDLAWNRTAPSDVPIRTLDALRFRCHRSGNCCRSDWGVSVGDQTREAYGRVDWSALVGPERGRDFIVPREGGEGHRLAARGADCIFHEGDRCAVHAAIGTPFNPTCVTFPVTFTWTPDGPEASASFTCPSVLHGRGEPLEERQEDLQARWWLWESEAIRIPEHVLLAPGHDTVTYSEFRRFESRVLAVLGREGCDLGSRVRDIVEAAERYTRSGGAGLDCDQTIALEPLSGGPVPTHGALDTFVFAASRLPRVSIRREFPPGVSIRLATWIAEQAISWPPPDARLVGYLRQVWFRKRWIPELGVVGQAYKLPLTWAALRAIASCLAWSDERSAVLVADLEQAIEAFETLILHGPGFSRLMTTDRLLRAQLTDIRWARSWLAYASCA